MAAPESRSGPVATALVTGATDGIGREVALGFAARGFNVIVHGRNRAKIEAVVQDIGRIGAGRCMPLQADLSRLDEVRGAAREATGLIPRLDVLVNNAGVFIDRREVSADGLELTLVTNYLSHFLLTELLRPRLVPGGVVVNVSSKAQASGHIHLGDLGHESSWSAARAYCQSKLAQVMHAMTLAETPGLRAYSLHPGVVRSKVLDSLEAELLRGHQISEPMTCVAASDGAAAIIMVAGDEVGARNGAYFYERAVAEPAAEARDADLRQALWDESRRLVGLPCA